MSDNDLNKGIGGYLDPGYKTKEDIKRDELNKFYKDHVENYKPQSTPQVKSLDDTYITDHIKPLEIKLEDPKRNKLGHTQADKNRIAEAWLTRPPDPIKKMVEKNMPITTYITKMNKMYGSQDDQQIKQLEDLKEFGRNPYTYKSKLDTVVENSQHPQDKYYEDEIKRIDKEGKSWLSKHFRKQDEKQEVARLQKIVERSAKAKVDQYGNPESATDRIQDQDRNRKNSESVSKRGTNKRKI